MNRKTTTITLFSDTPHLTFQQPMSPEFFNSNLESCNLNFNSFCEHVHRVTTLVDAIQVRSLFENCFSGSMCNKFGITMEQVVTVLVQRTSVLRFDSLVQVQRYLSSQQLEQVFRVANAFQCTEWIKLKNCLDTMNRNLQIYSDSTNLLHFNTSADPTNLLHSNTLIGSTVPPLFQDKQFESFFDKIQNTDDSVLSKQVHVTEQFKRNQIESTCSRLLRASKDETLGAILRHRRMVEWYTSEHTGSTESGTLQVHDRIRLERFVRLYSCELVKKRFKVSPFKHEYTHGCISECGETLNLRLLLHC